MLHGVFCIRLLVYSVSKCITLFSCVQFSKKKNITLLFTQFKFNSLNLFCAGNETVEKKSD